MDVTNKSNKEKETMFLPAFRRDHLEKRTLAGERNNFFTQEAFKILAMPTKSADKLQNSEVEA